MGSGPVVPPPMGFEVDEPSGGAALPPGFEPDAPPAGFEVDKPDSFATGLWDNRIKPIGEALVKSSPGYTLMHLPERAKDLGQMVAGHYQDLYRRGAKALSTNPISPEGLINLSGLVGNPYASTAEKAINGRPKEAAGEATFDVLTTLAAEGAPKAVRAARDLVPPPTRAAINAMASKGLSRAVGKLPVIGDAGKTLLEAGTQAYRDAKVAEAAKATADSPKGPVKGEIPGGGASAEASAKKLRDIRKPTGSRYEASEWDQAPIADVPGLEPPPTASNPPMPAREPGAGYEAPEWEQTEPFRQPPQSLPHTTVGPEDIAAMRRNADLGTPSTAGYLPEGAGVPTDLPTNGMEVLGPHPAKPSGLPTPPRFTPEPTAPAGVSDLANAASEAAGSTELPPQAQKLIDSIPPPEPGKVRVWRREGPLSQANGGWFQLDPGGAFHYNNGQGLMKYVDVPEAVVAKAAASRGMQAGAVNELTPAEMGQWAQVAVPLRGL